MIIAAEFMARMIQKYGKKVLAKIEEKERLDANKESEDTVEYDLTYFFENTGIVDEDDNEMTSFIIHTSEINRQLYAQYPDKETIARCAVMKDFGAQNDKVSELWIRVKGNTTSWYLYVILGVVVVVIIFAEVKSILNRKTRKNRNKTKNKA